MVKRLKHKSMDDMDYYGKPKKRYHQTKMDRRHESEGMKKHRSVAEERFPKKMSHQTRKDRMHESEGMRKHNRDVHREHYR